MITSLDAIDIIWQTLHGSSLASAVSGGIYKLSRPVNSIKEDVVINSITLNSDQLQEGVLNVNIHVPNLSLSIDGVVDNSQPNFSRLKTLTSIAVGILTDVWAVDGNYNFNVQEPGNPIEEPDINQHYSNIRIEFISVNL